MAQVASKLEGRQFGELVAISATSERSHNKTIMWLCKCLNCNTEVLVSSTKLKSGEIKSCGCMEHIKSSRTPAGHSGLNMLYQRYVQSAKKRKMSFELNKEDLASLTKLNCSYCGIAPSQTIYGSRGSKKEYGKYTYNGIDRVNNSLGYTLQNSVPCCRTCNIAKGTMPHNKFLNWVKRVYIENFTNA